MVHRVTYRVIYGDVDSMRVAYYANYLRWFEVGRTELLRSMGMTYRQMEDAGFFLPVTEVNCRYRSPALYDDLLIIETAVRELGRVKVGFSYRILREGTDELLAEGFTTHGCLSPEGKVVRIPADVVEGLTEFVLPGS